MRCEDLTRELASPTGSLSPVEMAGHLAGCPSCAERSSQAARFDRIWDTTRPLEPSPATIDALWLEASAALEARTAPRTLRLVPRRTWIKPTLILAQAAAILLAAGVFLSRQGQEPVPQVVEKATDLVKLPVAPPIQIASSLPEVHKWVVNVDETLVISIPANCDEEPKANRLTQNWPETSNLIPPGMPQDVINDAEAMAGHWVLSKR